MDGDLLNKGILRNIRYNNISIRSSILPPDQEKISTFSSSEVDMASAWIPLTKESPK